MIILRDYQKEAVDSVYEYWGKGRGDNPLVVAPTGSGKSLIIAEVIRSAISIDPSVRILMITHSKELISQNYLELMNIYPNCDAGIYSAGLNKRDRHNNVMFAGIQSIAKKIHQFDPFDIVVIDEAHTIPRKSTTLYGKTMDMLKMMNPQVKLLGLTATPYRLDSGRLFGKGCLFCGIAYEIDISYLIEQGYLCPVVSKGGANKIDLSNVKKRGGEYREDDMAIAASTPELISSVVDEVIEYGAYRKAWLVFGSNISHAELLKERFTFCGVENVTLLTGKTPKVERAKIVDDFKSGKIKCLINVGVLTTGFNAPICDLIAMVRATMSTGLYVQIVGRGMRIKDGKKDCLFLDYGNNVIQHGPIDAIPTQRSKQESDGGGEAPQKECPKCYSFCHIIAKECLDCGYIFPEREQEYNHDSKAYSGALLTSQFKPEVIEIDNVTYSRHKKMGRKDTLKMNYWSGIRIYSEWLPVGSFGQRAHDAMSYLKQLGSTETTIIGILKECALYKKPTKIAVVPNGKYYKVVNVFF
tara:strand:- start:44 stop:1624 length:1581 start_codon:yes stop_codon:yes gene_type:complete